MDQVPNSQFRFLFVGTGNFNDLIGIGGFYWSSTYVGTLKAISDDNGQILKLARKMLHVKCGC